MKKQCAAESNDPAEEIRIEHYEHARYWGVWRGKKLLAVTVYKRGAELVAELARKEKYPSIEER